MSMIVDRGTDVSESTEVMASRDMPTKLGEDSGTKSVVFLLPCEAKTKWRGGQA